MDALQSIICVIFYLLWCHSQQYINFLLCFMLNMRFSTHVSLIVYEMEALRLHFVIFKNKQKLDIVSTT